ncbi:Poly [ADP-ribose] polymerase 1 [Manis javanica]|nr:Poly [ADP-ribose] polymerase 1 [Manis javanica]
MFNGKVPHWYHFCFWKVSHCMRHPDVEVDGFSGLRWDDQEKFKKTAEAGGVTTFTNRKLMRRYSRRLSKDTGTGKLKPPYLGVTPSALTGPAGSDPHVPALPPFPPSPPPLLPDPPKAKFLSFNVLEISTECESKRDLGLLSAAWTIFCKRSHWKDHAVGNRKVGNSNWSAGPSQALAVAACLAKEALKLTLLQATCYERAWVCLSSSRQHYWMGQSLGNRADMSVLRDKDNISAGTSRHR